MMTALTGFKAYDIRGRLDDELNEDIASASAALMRTTSTPNAWWQS